MNAFVVNALQDLSSVTAPLKRGFRLAGASLVLLAAAAGHAAAEPQHKIAVLPFEIEDNSGEVGGAKHEPMLEGVTRAVADKMAASGLYSVVPEGKVDAAVAAVDSGTYLRACNGCERDIARRVGADRVMIGYFFKMSTLVLTLHVVIKDVETGQIVYAKSFDFRGDNEKAWQRAASFMVDAVARAEATN